MRQTYLNIGVTMVIPVTSVKYVYLMEKPSLLIDFYCILSLASTREVQHYYL